MHRLAVGEVINGRYEVTTSLRDGVLHNYWLAQDHVLDRPG